MEEIRKQYPGCRDSLIRRHIKAQVKAIWNDTKCPYTCRSFPDGVVWKDIKMLQVDMLDGHAAMMDNLLRKGVI